MKSILLYLFIFTSICSFSQKGINVLNPVIDLGVVEDYKNRELFFNLENSTNDTIFLEPFPMNAKLLIKLANNKIPPQSITKMKVIYFTNRKGYFEETFTLHTTTSEPISFQIRGIIHSISYDNISSNPMFDFNTPGHVKSVSGDRDIRYLVIEDKTLKPMPYASILFQNIKTNKKFIGVTDSTGIIVNRIPDGQYRSECLTKGYQKEISKTRIDEYNNLVLIMVLEEEPILASTKLTPPPPKKVIVNAPKEPVVSNEIPTNSEISTFKADDMIKELEHADKKGLNMIFLLDISTSMDKPNRIELVKQNLKNLIDQYDSSDHFSLLVFNEKTQVLYPSSKISNKATLKKLIDEIVPSGNTEGSAAVESAFDYLTTYSKDNQYNMIVLATDGKINANSQEDKKIFTLIDQMNSKGFLFSVWGFGSSAYEMLKLEKMATIGGGIFLKMTSQNEMNDRVLIDEIYRTLERIK